MSTAANYCAMTISNTPGTGVANLGSALAAPNQSFFSAYGAVSTTVDVEWYSDAAGAVPLGVERNCVYNGGNPGTLTRGTFESPSTSLVSIPAGASVRVVSIASAINNYERALSAVIPGGRLTLTSGVPVTTSDVTGATSIFYTPFVHNVVPLWNGTDWVPTTFTEYSRALNYAGALTSGRPYDVFGYLNGSAFEMEFLAWTNDTTRATAVTLQDGRYCKSGDKTRLLLGTFYTTSTTQTEDSAVNRYLWNAYNQRTKICKSPAGVDHIYNAGTLRNWNNGSGAIPRVQVVCGLPVSCATNLQALVYYAANPVSMNSTIRAYADAVDILGADLQFVAGFASASGAAGGWLAGTAAVGLAPGRHYFDIYEAEYGGLGVSYSKGLTTIPGWQA